MLQEKEPITNDWRLFLVDLAGEISNCIFSDLQVLCERLEELDIEVMMPDDWF